MEEQKAYLKKLEDYAGILLVNKPVGLTSRAIDTFLKRKLQCKKVGHVGTLDPFAEGLLPLCIGRATSVVPYLEGSKKAYRLILHLGAASDSMDSQGKLILAKDYVASTGRGNLLTSSGSYKVEGNSVTEVLPYLDSTSKEGQERMQAILANDAFLLKEVLRSCLNLREQFPPVYSAIKIQGKPLYAYARAGQLASVELKPRPIRVYKASLKELRWIEANTSCALHTQKQKAKDFPAIATVDESLAKHQQNYPLLEAVIDFEVSKGTYLRSLGTYIAEQLGLLAYAAGLCRTYAEPYSLKNSMDWKWIQEAKLEDLLQKFLPLDTALKQFPILSLNENEALALLQGKTPYYSLPEALHKEALLAVEAFWKGRKQIIGLVKWNKEKKKLYVERMFTHQS